MTDRDIIEGFLAGRQADVSTILRWIRAVVANSAWRGSMWQEDVAADALTRLYIALSSGKFKYGSTLRTYVYRITQYVVIDWLRQQKRFDEALRNLMIEIEHYPDAADRLLEEARQAEMLAFVWASIDDKCRRIWHMAFYERLDYAEIAYHEGANVGTVKQWMFRCKEKAQKLVKERQTKLGSQRATHD